MSIKCRHEAWEESPGGDRKCADCREWLEPVPPKAPTADFQVGDRVSIEGVVTAIFEHDYVQVQFCTKAGTLIQLEPEELTLIERPRRKLRVGSVWECPEGDRYVVVPDDYSGRALRGLGRSDVIVPMKLFDPTRWREVPVEELERESQ